MLYGDFSESSKDKDDPIQITSVEANAFDIAMRYIYGGETDFQDVPTACKVYRFAHEWLLNSLMTAASEFLKNPSPDDVITVHEMYKTFNDHSHSEKLLSIIAANTSAVLKSAAWLKSTSSTVLEIFKMEYLKVGSEEELFEALFAWGSADGNTGETITDEDAIRAKTSDALKLIRFMTIDSDKFGELCNSDCAKLMTEKDRLKVFMSINLSDKRHLPENFSVIQNHRKLNRSDVKIILIGSSKSVDSDATVSKNEKSVFTFAIKKCNRFYLRGVQLQCLSQTTKFVHLICKLTQASSPRVLASVLFKGINLKSNQNWLHFPIEVHIKENILYTLTVEYFHNDPVPSKTSSNIGQNVFWSDSDLHLIMQNASNTVTDIVGLSFYKS
ncbi:uncharacterized protein LOC132194951 isoform X2 [Neocloeon triangulifer]|nr:uncharacterized protein LOC132194951 isoform X2 [Neocloeon triangulifer]